MGDEEVSESSRIIVQSNRRMGQGGICLNDSRDLGLNSGIKGKKVISGIGHSEKREVF